MRALWPEVLTWGLIVALCAALWHTRPQEAPRCVGQTVQGNPFAADAAGRE